MHTQQFFTWTQPVEQTAIVANLKKVCDIFLDVNLVNQEESFYRALHFLRTSLETLGNLTDFQSNQIAKKICSQAKQLRHALIHGGPRINDPNRITPEVCQVFAFALLDMIEVLNNKAINENQEISMANFFSNCTLYQQLIDFDSVEKSLNNITPQEHLSHIEYLYNLSRKVTDLDVYAYCWGGFLESLVQLEKLELRDTLNNTRQQYSHIYNQIGTIKRWFDESIVTALAGRHLKKELLPHSIHAAHSCKIAPDSTMVERPV